MQKENEEKDLLIKAANEANLIAIQDAENEGSYVAGLEKEIKHLKAHAAAEAKRHLEVKKKLFDEF